MIAAPPNVGESPKLSAVGRTIRPRESAPSIHSFSLLQVLKLNSSLPIFILITSTCVSPLPSSPLQLSLALPQLESRQEALRFGTVSITPTTAKLGGVSLCVSCTHIATVLIVSFLSPIYAAIHGYIQRHPIPFRSSHIGRLPQRQVP